MVAKTNNHFITVAKDGMMHARRTGQGSVAIAKGSVGLEVTPDSAMQERGVPARLLVRFRPGGSNRAIMVTEIVVGNDVLPLEEFQARFQVTDDELGRCMRSAVDAVLDRSAREDPACR